jgi:hypothetical protein
MVDPGDSCVVAVLNGPLQARSPHCAEQALGQARRAELHVLHEEAQEEKPAAEAECNPPRFC